MSHPQRLVLASLFISSIVQPSLLGANGVENVIVYRESGRYAGWPANHGIWSWGNEIVVGFESGYFHFSETRHSIDWDRPAQHLLARSTDGGETWSIEDPESLKPPPNAMVAKVHTEPGGKRLTDCPGFVDFTSPGFALTLRMEDVNVGPSRFYYSYESGEKLARSFSFARLWSERHCRSHRLPRKRNA